MLYHVIPFECQPKLELVELAGLLFGVIIGDELNYMVLTVCAELRQDLFRSLNVFLRSRSFSKVC